MRVWLSIFLLVGVAACTTIGDDTRYQFGVSADAKATVPGVPGADALAWKAGQICTRGSEVTGRDVVKTEEGGEIVDNHLKCARYRPSLGFAGVAWLPGF